MPISQEQLRRLQRVKAKHEVALMKKANVVGVGVGFQRRRGALTDEPAIVVSVTHKVPRSDLADEDVVPRELDGVPVDVEAVGTLRPLEVGAGEPPCCGDQSQSEAASGTRDHQAG